MSHFFRRVEEHKFHSVAIPAISSGIFNLPLMHSAETIVRSVKEHIEKQQTQGTLLTINLVRSNLKTVTELEKACIKLLSQNGSSITKWTFVNDAKSLSQGCSQTPEEQV